MFYLWLHSTHVLSGLAFAGDADRRSSSASVAKLSAGPRTTYADMAKKNRPTVHGSVADNATSGQKPVRAHLGGDAKVLIAGKSAATGGDGQPTPGPGVHRGKVVQSATHGEGRSSVRPSTTAPETTKSRVPAATSPPVQVASPEHKAGLQTRDFQGRARQAILVGERTTEARGARKASPQAAVTTSGAPPEGVPVGKGKSGGINKDAQLKAVAKDLQHEANNDAGTTVAKANKPDTTDEVLIVGTVTLQSAAANGSKAEVKMEGKTKAREDTEQLLASKTLEKKPEAATLPKEECGGRTKTSPSPRPTGWLALEQPRQHEGKTFLSPSVSSDKNPKPPLAPAIPQDNSAKHSQTVSEDKAGKGSQPLGPCEDQALDSMPKLSAPTDIVVAQARSVAEASTEENSSPKNPASTKEAVGPVAPEVPVSPSAHKQERDEEEEPMRVELQVLESQAFHIATFSTESSPGMTNPSSDEGAKEVAVSRTSPTDSEPSSSRQVEAGTGPSTVGVESVASPGEASSLSK